MIQRSVLRSSRAVAQSASQSTSSLRLRPQPSLLRPSRFAQPRISSVASRWYSEATEAKNGAAAPAEGEASAAEPAPAAEAEDPLRKELEAKTKEALDFKDKYLRSVADFRNLQERSKREQAAAKDFAIQKFAKDLVESVDTFDIALTTVPKDKLDAQHSEHNSDLANLYGGLKMTERILMQTLKKHGLERFDPAEGGERFDPNVHEALFMTPQPEKEDGTVFHTQQKGFLLNGRVLRAAKVGVVKNS
ncbi:hypothetical protein B0A49_11410 [Cryomyces minteri]|uniref:GrpE protein homolog n=1 Tax=Cryomyces minteri TaxID=331657 RepID=A0A4V6WKG0_9PEZI|nr:hypothetical protein B0A49_11410 [Cryomyces minteri]